MKEIENIIILVLLLIIGYLYCKEDIETFLVSFQPYYPITADVSPKFNNYTNSIEDKRFNLLKNALDYVRNISNDGSTEFKEFNIINLPVSKYSLELKEVKKLTDYLLEEINKNLEKSYSLILHDVKDINKYETENEAKINLRLICQFKIKTNDDFKLKYPVRLDYDESNKLIILVEVISKKNVDNENIYINYIQISGLTSGGNLPGQNHFNNNSNFLISDFNKDNIIENKIKLNSEEVDSFNLNIGEDDFLNNVTIEESVNESYINTEEADSFFNL